ncbi:GDSL-type esterase/lipase family protein [Flammeovirga kamogawensis]|uniref:SGNH hydrolase-type esterase domain-containing protein n=1 Tax=Flammeovirga kamogawensis TaxID=373891 RepID=A0ABX8GRL3_9BACT|nr:GDSL-type esterase/lipase family protein [Flammeovirga kamogawensis]MBB6463459.1 lysophospholipase L1-like esterase [Flammeovirga kamogawensis]QWG05615.1 hypothetical protein KM029_09485 [Flammeovirga kamogawensis]TRX67447.1 hypothetical protein EO216_04525 [Flammeovirga kamogawensis]
MKTLCYIFLFFTLPTYAAKVTLRVDMAGFKIHTEGIHLSGNINNWKLKETQLINTKGTIYEITLEVEPKKTYEYKYFNGAEWSTGEYAFGPCANGGFRTIQVDGDSILPIVPYNGCTEKFDLKDKIRIACVGNSITYGHGIPERFANCYPTQLQHMLGENYLVNNFGNSGRTLSKDVNDSYWSTAAFTQSHTTFLPNKVVIMLGTNDSKPQIWDISSQHFESDLNAFITSYQSLSSNPEIYLATPPMIYPNTFDIRNQIVEKEIIPILIKVAKERNIKIIPIHEATKNMKKDFPDGVHPNYKGATVIAEEIYKKLIRE